MIIDLKATDLAVGDNVRATVDVISKIRKERRYSRVMKGEVTEIVGKIIRVKFRTHKKPVPVMLADVVSAWRFVPEEKS